MLQLRELYNHCQAQGRPASPEDKKINIKQNILYPGNEILNLSKFSNFEVQKITKLKSTNNETIGSLDTGQVAINDYRQWDAPVISNHQPNLPQESWILSKTGEREILYEFIMDVLAVSVRWL